MENFDICSVGTNEELEHAIATFRETHKQEDGETVADFFIEIARCLITSFPASMLGGKDDKEVIKFLLFNCMYKLHHFDSDKGKAFHYFTTLMLNYLKKEHQRSKKRLKLEQMYGRYYYGL